MNVMPHDKDKEIEQFGMRNGLNIKRYCLDLKIKANSKKKHEIIIAENKSFMHMPTEVKISDVK